VFACDARAVRSLLFLPVIALIVGGVIYTWRRNAALREGLANLARANGWTYTARLDSLAAAWRQDPFGEGHSRQCRNVVQGVSDGWPFVAIDYQYTTRSGDDDTTHPYAVTAVQLAVPLPALSVTLENVVSRLLGHDIELESEDFNRRFRVKADVPKFAYDVLTARTMQMLLSRPPLSWHFEGPWLVCFTRGDLSPVTLLSHLDTAKQLLAGVPPFVWKDLGLPESTPR
jgi:hypothetical protein